MKEFSNFTNRLKDDYHNLDDDDPHQTPQYLMDKAENKFKILINEGTWDATMKNKDELMTIKAKLRKLKRQKGGQKGKTKISKIRVNENGDFFLMVKPFVLQNG